MVIRGGICPKSTSIIIGIALSPNTRLIASSKVKPK